MTLALALPTAPLASPGTLLADPEFFILFVVAIPFLFVLSITYMKFKFSAASQRSPAIDQAAHAVREEMARMRAETNELILSYESTITRLERRITILESARDREHAAPSNVPLRS